MRRRTNIVWRRAPGFLALSREGRDVTVVHGAAADIWELIEGGVDKTSIVTTLTARYGAPAEVVRTDVEELIDLLTDQGYLEATDGE
ncbi:PqqD family peptide modification chaperone [Nostocoides sp. F2B08]|uniref:PqqD family protein n=1 Tax=Nostocoides sp. F2B08 TaxID=2653936 RepID=UPI001262F0FC|nr:PqqD family protein [Tetrasphaera sp. F2B08]KAB7743344.1 PqqD family peptide modification chaperone [Tetrasphaera sp. F2B08]